jgi:hypothetical protein
MKPTIFSILLLISALVAGCVSSQPSPPQTYEGYVRYQKDHAESTPDPLYLSLCDGSRSFSIKYIPSQTKIEPVKFIYGDMTLDGVVGQHISITELGELHYWYVRVDGYVDYLYGTIDIIKFTLIESAAQQCPESSR